METGELLRNCLLKMFEEEEFKKLQKQYPEERDQLEGYQECLENLDIHKINLAALLATLPGCAAKDLLFYILSYNLDSED